MLIRQPDMLLLLLFLALDTSTRGTGTEFACIFPAPTQQGQIRDIFLYAIMSRCHHFSCEGLPQQPVQILCGWQDQQLHRCGQPNGRSGEQEQKHGGFAQSQCILHLLCIYIYSYIYIVTFIIYPIIYINLFALLNTSTSMYLGHH